MGRRTTEKVPRSHTLPSSPTHSSSSSDFEFTISVSPRKSTAAAADDLFYKGQLLPLHLSPRLSMVRHLLLSSSSTSSSATTATASRDSSGSSTDSHSSFTSDLLLLAPDCDSSRPSSAAEDDEFKRLNHHHNLNHQIKKPKYFSFSRISSVFRKEPKTTTTRDPDSLPGSSTKRVSSTAKDVIRKYLKKVKPLYEKLSQSQTQKQNQKIVTTTTTTTNLHHPTNIPLFTDRSVKHRDTINTQIQLKEINGGHSHSFSGNLRYPRRRSCVSSCPSSMRSSPSHSGVLSWNGFSGTGRGGGACYSDSSSMEELQSAIQGAIAHCKNSMIQQ